MSRVPSGCLACRLLGPDFLALWKQGRGVRLGLWRLWGRGWGWHRRDTWFPCCPVIHTFLLLRVLRSQNCRRLHPVSTYVGTWTQLQA